MSLYGYETTSSDMAQETDADYDEIIHCQFCGESDVKRCPHFGKLASDDPNCCEFCGGDLAKNAFCWECDF